MNIFIRKSSIGPLTYCPSKSEYEGTFDIVFEDGIILECDKIRVTPENLYLYSDYYVARRDYIGRKYRYIGKIARTQNTFRTLDNDVQKILNDKGVNL